MNYYATFAFFHLLYNQGFIYSFIFSLLLCFSFSPFIFPPFTPLLILFSFTFGSSIPGSSVSMSYKALFMQVLQDS